MVIYISGSGKFAHELALACAEANVRHDSMKALTRSPREKSVVIHVGSRQRYPETLRICEHYGIPLILASTAHDDLITTPKCPIIVAPNCSVMLVYVIEKILPHIKALMRSGVELRITEVHQMSKKDAPSGTAVLIASKLDIPLTSIESIRVGDLARSEHAITLSAPDIEIRLSMTTKGLRPYAMGAIALAHAVLDRQLVSAVYLAANILGH